jgi:hypothetical protein
MGENAEENDTDWLDFIREPANPLPLLQAWYLKQCDGDWEHASGIRIETLDNPGWSVRITVTDTRLEGKPFARIEQDNSDSDWMHCWLEELTWRGAGDPKKLNLILLQFLDWAAREAPM